MKLPQAFEHKMKDLLGDEYSTYLRSYDLPKYRGFRINTLKVSKEKWQSMNPFQEVKGVPWCEEGFYYGEEERPGKHPYYFAGLYYIQEPSAMAPGAYIPIEEGDKVLDLCAAPGGKSTQVGARLGQTGLLVSNDISASRAKTLAKNIENFGIRYSIVTSETSEKLGTRWQGYFDKILIDAPCSGEGMFRKDEEAVKSWETYGVEYCCKLQESILEDAAKMLKPNGMILYSTCTFSPEENEQMIATFLEQHPDFHIVPLEPKGGILKGRADWANGDESLSGTLRLWPHHIEGEGHFVCLLERVNEGISSKPVKSSYKRLKDYPVAAEFFREQTHFSMEEEVQELKGKLYLIRPDGPPLDGLRVLRSGLFLGEIKNKRFEPSHGVLLAFPKEMFKHTIDFKGDDEYIIRYLKGETLLYEAEKGYHVICIDGYPLGWVKAQNSTLKNQYPPSWRMMG